MAKKPRVKIEYVPIEQVKPDPDNPRTISKTRLAELKKSVREFEIMMELRPIVVDNDWIAKGGNQRLRACQELGWKEVPVIHAKDLTPEELEEFMVKDNIHAGAFSWGMLFTKFGEDKLIGWGVDTTGVTPDEIKKKEIEENQKRIDAMEVQFNEHHDYIVFLFDNVNDFLRAVSHLKLKKVPTSLSPKTKTLGLGRVVPGQKLLTLIPDK